MDTFGTYVRAQAVDADLSIEAIRDLTGLQIRVFPHKIQTHAVWIGGGTYEEQSMKVWQRSAVAQSPHSCFVRREKTHQFFTCWG